MGGEMFAGFMVNAEMYAACEEYWYRMVQGIAERIGQSGDWRPWMPRLSPNGLPLERDGNPIFDAVSTKLGRAIRIIQEPSESEEIELSSWVEDRSGEAWPSQLPKEELVIYLALTANVEGVVGQLIELWMHPEITVEAMREFFEHHPSVVAG